MTMECIMTPSSHPGQDRDDGGISATCPSIALKQGPMLQPSV
ncbi:unnamed protein product [Chondrus crispus]|uniref:Uncharacterized protein n=1 Tax=Chondrus crispus TaxID=2769 RepID=R7QHX9_CHOCR|nr:unnamed protein product [Chondrus crispus]CDF37689.1 unnamed protein product [Chondrus crispus]|eukprot:XP_005717560.1 unnamed protein product [Chondrus crispus]